MKVTAQTKTTIIQALSEKGWNMSDLANKIDRTRSWVSKLLSKKGGINELSDELVDRLSDVLGVPVNPIVTTDGKVSATALRLSQIAENDPQIAGLLEQVLALAEPEESAYIPVVETKNLPKIGAAITRIVHRWEEPNDPHYAKIGSEALTFLRKYFGK